MNEIPDQIDYQSLVQDALRWVVRRSLEQVATYGLPGAHHFYIAFATDAPEVVLSNDLREKYPENITIVLQEDFRDLEVEEGGFAVTLRFGGQPQRIYVPWNALVSFYDPSEQFALRFEPRAEPRSTPAPAPSPVAVDAEGQPNPRPPVKGLLAAADRLAEEKARREEEEAAREAEEAGESAAASKKGSAKKGAKALTSAKAGSAKKGTAKKGPAKKGTAKKGPAKKGTAKKASGPRAAPQAAAEPEAVEGGPDTETAADSAEDARDSDKGGVVVSFEDFRRR